MVILYSPVARVYEICAYKIMQFLEIDIHRERRRIAELICTFKSFIATGIRQIRCK